MNDEQQQLTHYRAIGKLESFTEFPAAVEVDHDSYFILQEQAEDTAPIFRLVSALCPHAGGYVRPYEGELICPLHFWSFDTITGASTNVPGEALECQPLELIEGQLFIKQPS